MLNHHHECKSKQSISHIKNSITYISANSSSFHVKFPPDSSVLKVLHTYVHRLTNNGDRNLTFLKNSAMETRATALSSSKYPSQLAYWSLMWNIAAKTNSIELNLQDSSPSSSFEHAWFWHELDKVALDSCSRLHQDQQFTKKNGVYVKNFEVLCERIFGWKLKF